jgi:hypothetical protein
MVILTLCKQVALVRIVIIVKVPKSASVIRIVQKTKHRPKGECSISGQPSRDRKEAVPFLRDGMTPLQVVGGLFIIQ